MENIGFENWFNGIKKGINILSGPQSSGKTELLKKYIGSNTVVYDINDEYGNIPLIQWEEINNFHKNTVRLLPGYILNGEPQYFTNKGIQKSVSNIFGSLKTGTLILEDFSAYMDDTSPLINDLITYIKYTEIKVIFVVQSINMESIKYFAGMAQSIFILPKPE